jgi:hypothetical protein
MCYPCANAACNTSFFTVSLAERRSDLLMWHIDDLRATMKLEFKSPEDMSAAAQALMDGYDQQVAPFYVDPYYRNAFDQLIDPAINC